ncbi:hypothetical protein BC936DRAFT_139059 [Jimgerdemannia flammicorona]|uniref:Cilia- and flagella-associated protein 300 n=1 Tax=Jimgerdemannia flammicorona TaxID=994334 RepID=A0A433BAR1_9FUNG|nr:hypothetical protein BC936DRAFT_139059 [Jimgerdemannia flammicorona]
MPFHFQFHKEAKLDDFYCRQTQEALDRWGLRHHTYLRRFTYEEYFYPKEEAEGFLSDFFMSAEVQANFEKLPRKTSTVSKRLILLPIVDILSHYAKEIVADHKDDKGNPIWKTIGSTIASDNITHTESSDFIQVKFERLNATVVSLEYFDPLVENGTLPPNQPSNSDIMRRFVNRHVNIMFYSSLWSSCQMSAHHGHCSRDPQRHHGFGRVTPTPARSVIA